MGVRKLYRSKLAKRKRGVNPEPLNSLKKHPLLVLFLFFAFYHGSEIY
jgi:hypothetical protein